ncbi:hypothetical protein CYL31_12230 [Marinomonas sp. A3A]|nr:hypothetical protein CYL31_12230 [Marinomonas sp. A3A]
MRKGRLFFLGVAFLQKKRFLAMRSKNRFVCIVDGCSIVFVWWEVGDLEVFFVLLRPFVRAGAAVVRA